MPGRISLFYAVQFLRLCFEVNGAAVFLHPPRHFSGLRHKGILQPLLRTGSTVRATGRAIRAVPEKGHPGLDEE